MIKTIDIKCNRIIYPLQRMVGLFIHYVLKIFIPLAPPRFRNTLRKLECNVFAMNVIGLTFFNAVGGLLVMATNVKLANILGASVYGIYAFYIAIGEMGSNFVRYGRHKTMTRDLIQKSDNFDSLISNTFVLGLINIVIFLLVMVIFSKPLTIEITMVTILLMVAPSIGCVDFQPVYESMKLISWHACYHLIQKFIFFAGIGIAIIGIVHPTLLYISVILFISWFVILLIQYREIIVNLRIHICKHISFPNIWDLYKSNFLISLSCFMGVAFGPIIQMVLKKSADAAAVGVYAAGMQIFLLCQFFFNQISRVGNPMMAEAGKKECSIEQRRFFVKRYTIIMLIAAIPFLLPLVVFPHFTADVFYTKEYSDLGALLPWYGIYLIGLAIGIVYTQFLISMRKDKEYFAIYITSAIATVICAFAIIPPLGVLGAVISLCIPHTIGCVCYFLFSLKYLK